MINKTIEEKNEMLLDIQEHPDRYSEEQLEELLKDEEIKSLVHDSAMIKRAIIKQHPQKVDVDEAWQQFSQTHSMHRHNWIKIVASITGIVFLSGVALAAVIQLGVFHSSQSVKPNIRPNITEPVKSKVITKTESEIKKDSTAMKPVVFENAELGDILSQMANFYHVKVVYKNEETSKIRLYFNWDKQQSLNHCLEILNGFDRINIIYSDNTITVE